MASKNRVVVRYRDGRVAKGYLWDFLPTKDSFHLSDAVDENKVSDVAAGELKAIFFVRSFEGNRFRKGKPEPEWGRSPGRKLKVTFLDGEVVYGTTNGYMPGRPGFFLVPADNDDNNERAYVFTGATRAVEFADAAPRSVPGAAGGRR